MKRFYTEVAVTPLDDGFAVLLDSRPVKTPGGKRLNLPRKRLADAIAAEWQAQGDTVMITSMPLLRLANTVIDGVADNRQEVIGAILRFGENDLLCYRAHQPPELAARQAAAWDPLLDWVAQRYGANMRVAAGLTHIDQPHGALAALRRGLESCDAFSLSGLHVIASVTGSLILALAVADGFISGARAFDLSRIDEIYQAEKWGEDAEAATRTIALAHELDKAAELIALVRPETE